METRETPPTETVSECPLCNSTKIEFLFANQDRLHRLPGNFGLVKCIECGLLRLSPRPKLSEMGFYYPGTEYYSYQTPARIRHRGALAQLRDQIRYCVLDSLGYPQPDLHIVVQFLRRVVAPIFFRSGTFGYGKSFPEFVYDGRALDIGCGNGLFLSHLKNCGWSVSGVDLSDSAAKSAIDAFDIEVFVGNVEDAGFGENSFDFISLNHSIEHLPDPIKTLTAIYPLLKSTGSLYIETPNASSYNFRAFGPKWIHTDCPRHLFLFSPNTLRLALEKAGFEVLRTETNAYSAYSWFDTFTQEEALREKLPNRPRLRTQSLAKSGFHSLASHLSHTLDKNTGDVLKIWAHKGVVLIK
jgi:2-polyprenyl-3-methyl-5-hydroxy-6-metoxy-1,4-benzoquinol methylase